MLKPLLELVNASTREGIFPPTLVVKLIYKKGTKEDTNSYRPVTLFQVLSKILEKVIAYQLINSFKQTQRI
jgi:hypothetical protein